MATTFGTTSWGRFDFQGKGVFTQTLGFIRLWAHGSDARPEALGFRVEGHELKAYQGYGCRFLGSAVWDPIRDCGTLNSRLEMPI